MGISYTPTIYILYIHIYLRERRWASCRCVCLCVCVYLSVCVYVFVRVRMSLYVHVHLSMSHNASATTSLRLTPGICREPVNAGVNDWSKKCPNRLPIEEEFTFGANSEQQWPSAPAWGSQIRTSLSASGKRECG